MAVRNAFSAFGFQPDAATIDTLRADLAFALRSFIERSQHSGMGQNKIGEILGLRQSIVSQIKKGNIEHLSVERLIKAMVRARIPGFAEWGPDSEDARAAVGVRVVPSQATSVSVTAPIGNIYQERWIGDTTELTDKPWLQVSGTE